jgi:glycosyltransferase involved in cell wall biosynthesis
VKAAMLCSGVGRVQRGFERLVCDLFEGLRPDLDLTLFKGGGPRRDGERPVFNLPRHGLVNRWLQPWRLGLRSPYFMECASFAAAAWPALKRGGYDVVHYIDLPVGMVLGRMRDRFGADFRLLYTQGVVIDPSLYPPYDHVHQVAQVLHDEAVEAGRDPVDMTMIPCGLDCDHFTPPAPRAELRRRHGLPDETLVVLSICALNREQKRVDHLVEEFVRSGDDGLLWVDGQPEDASLVELGAQRLGDRFRCTRVAGETLPELYGLADVFVLASLQESFGLAVVEAMAAGRPVLVHDSPHFAWLVPDARQRVDMAAPGAAAERLAAWRADPELREELGRANAAEVRRRFDWSVLMPRYRALFESLAGVPA